MGQQAVACEGAAVGQQEERGECTAADQQAEEGKGAPVGKRVEEGHGRPSKRQRVALLKQQEGNSKYPHNAATCNGKAHVGIMMATCVCLCGSPAPRHK